MTGYFFMPAFKAKRWDGRNRLLHRGKDYYYFMSGLLPKVESILNNFHQPYEIIDNRNRVKLGRKLITKIEQRDYQQKAIDAAVKHGSGLISIPTGGGKTAITAGIIASFNVPTMVYVPGIDLLSQTRDALKKFLNNRQIGTIGDGIVDIELITVATIWTAVTALGKKYEKLDDEEATKKEKFQSSNKQLIAKAIRNAKMFIVDECQFLGTSTLQHINTASSNARFRIGMSATCEREDNADLLLEGATGPMITNVTASELIHDDFLVPPTIHMINVPKMPGLKKNYQAVYKKYIVENDARNDKIVKSSLKLADAGHKVLILIKQIKHGEILLEKFKNIDTNRVIHFTRGELRSGARDEIKEKFMNNEFNILIASTIYDQGIDISDLDALILGCGGKSHGRLMQRIGRVIRKHPGKKKAIVVDFIDNENMYLLKHSAKRIETYKRESGFIIKLPNKPVKLSTW